MIVGMINKIDLNLVIICFLSITFNACHKIEREAKIVTKGVSEVTATSVKASGEIIDLGEGISRYGHILYDQQGEFLSQSFADTSAAIGVYTTIINGLNPNTTYYVSAYAETSKRTVYGNMLSFTTIGYPPEAAFTGSPTTVAPGQSVQFTDQSTNNPTSWSWNFGDGGTSTSHNPSHTYSTAGTYTVTLTATNSAGSDVAAKSNYITVSPLLNDNFESYTVGSFPSSWVADGNATEISQNNIVNNISYSSTKSLKLFGSLGGCWAALAYHSLNTSAPFEVELAVRNGNEVLSGCNPDRATIGLRNGTSWMNPQRLFVKFDGNGRIYGGGGLDLVSYNTNTWYLLRIKYERISSSQIRLSYWINNNYVAYETLSAINEESQLNNLEISVLEGSAWFDDIKIIK